MKSHSWILVANKEKAKVYKIVKVGKCEEVANFLHPDIGKKGIDYQEDRLGRSFDRMGGGRHAIDPQTTIDDKKIIAFSRILLEFLKSCLDRGEFKHLYIAAEPRFLGFIRKDWPKEILDTVEESIPKDLIHESPQSIWDHLEINV